MRETSLEDLLDTFFKYKITDMFTSIPCRVVSVKTELNDQRVDVQPMPLRKLRDGGTQEIPTILNVPVIFPASKKAAFTFPIDVGDTVLCVFSQRSMDGFKAGSGNDLYEPQDVRKFSVRDACAIPGLFPFDLAVNDPQKRTWTHSTKDAVLVNNIGTGQENEIRLKEDGDIQFKTNQDIYGEFNVGNIECSTLTITCTSMTVDGNLIVTGTADITGNVTASSNLDVSGDITAGGDVAASGDVTAGPIPISLLTHVHGGISPGGGTTAAPQ